MESNNRIGQFKCQSGVIIVPDFVVHVVEHIVFVDQGVLAFQPLVQLDAVNAIVFDIPNTPIIEFPMKQSIEYIPKTIYLFLLSHIIKFKS